MSESESKRTKGEWKMDTYGRNGARVMCVEPLAEQVICYSTGRATQEEAEANALMWAAAPELDASLREILLLFMEHATVHERNIEPMNRASAALNKARGKP